MENRFNLLDEPWLPVAGRSGARASLLEVFSQDSPVDFLCDAREKIALTKFLLAIAQAACTPQNDREWRDLDAEGLRQKIVTYLQSQRDNFWLYGDKPFLQYRIVMEKMPVNSKTGKKIVRSYVSLRPGGSENAKMFYNAQHDTAMTDADKAVLLIVEMNCGFGSKPAGEEVTLGKGVVKKSTLPSGPATCTGVGDYNGALHTFLQGKNLVQTVWLNLLTQENITAEKVFRSGLGVPPWEKMPQAENDEIATSLATSYLGRLVGLSRFLYLADEGVYLTSGVEYPGYTEGALCPSMTAMRQITEKESKTSIIWTRSDKRPWRELPSILSFLARESQAGSKFVCPQVRCCLPRLYPTDLESVMIWSGGLQMKVNSGNQYPGEKCDHVTSLFEIHLDWLREGKRWFQMFEEQMANLANVYAKRLFASVLAYYQMLDGAGQQDKKEAASPFAAAEAARATEIFWERAGQMIDGLADACASKDRQEVDAAMARMAQAAKDAYNSVCSSEGPVRFVAWVRSEPRLKITKARNDADGKTASVAGGSNAG